MAPIKFDENIKNKLEKRTVQPSSDAWNTLSEQLDAHDKKNSRSLFFYIGIAASIVGVLFVTTLFFNASEEQSISPIVVETEAKENLDKTESMNAVNINDVELAERNSDLINTKVNREDNESVIQSSINNESKVAVISEENSLIEQNDKQPKSLIKSQESVALMDNTANDKKKEMTLNTLSFEQLKVKEVVAEITQLQANGNAVSDAEIETLLKQAEKEILRQRIYNETTRTVNADALLQDVEEDLEQSFRTQVFEGLLSRYKKVKSAVAERNN